MLARGRSRGNSRHSRGNCQYDIDDVVGDGPDLLSLYSSQRLTVPQPFLRGVIFTLEGGRDPLCRRVKNSSPISVTP